jgi:cytochrome bd ubiquinol oxidase subunit I
MFELPEALLLARIQFAFTVSFHFLFPAVSIGWPATWRCSKACG